MLGSISELPAETCKEIKVSEGGQAVSGKHWFDSIIPGREGRLFSLTVTWRKEVIKLREKMTDLKPHL